MTSVFNFSTITEIKENNTIETNGDFRNGLFFKADNGSMIGISKNKEGGRYTIIIMDYGVIPSVTIDTRHTGFKFDIENFITNNKGKVIEISRVDFKGRLDYISESISKI